MSDLLERLCEIMHDAYEVAAVRAGWETQPRSRVPWTEVPEPNKVTMRAAVQAMLDSGLVVPAAALAERDATIARVDAIHRPDPSEPGWCAADGFGWPCNTRRALNGGGIPTGMETEQ